MKRKDESESSEEGSESEGTTAPGKPQLKKDAPVSNKSTKAPPPPSSSDEEDEEEDEEDSDSTTAGAAAKPQPGPKSPAGVKRVRDDKTDSQPEAKKMKMEEQPAKTTSKNKEKGETKAAEVAEKNNGTKQNKKSEKKDEQPGEKETKDQAKLYFKRTWSAKDEAALAQQLLEDLKAGVDFRTKVKSDSYWTELLETLKPKLENEYTKDQVFDKHRRIRSKYEKSGASRSRKRTPSDEALHNLMKQIWGPEAVRRPTPANSKGPAIKAGMSDDEESNGEMDTSALEPKKLEHLMNDAAKTGDGSRHKNPMSSFVASVCSEMVNGYKLGSAAAVAAAAGMNGKLRTHILEVMEAECDVMRRRLQVASEIYSQEMELIKKLRNNRSH